MKLRIKYIFGLYYIQRKRKYWFGWSHVDISHQESVAKARLEYLQTHPEML